METSRRFKAPELELDGVFIQPWAKDGAASFGTGFAVKVESFHLPQQQELLKQQQQQRHRNPLSTTTREGLFCYGGVMVR